MPSVKPPYETFAKIKVVGVGGSGGNAVSHMAAGRIRGVEFAAVNTDAQDLHHTNVRTKVHIGKATTRGLGAGMSPELGRQSAEENREDLRELVKDADMVFVTCGLGGGTGSGASPVIAEAAKEAGALTVAVVTKPFTFEGRQRVHIANEAWEQLRRHVDAIVTIENDRLLDVIDKHTSLLQAFRAVNEVLRQAVAGIAEMITVPGLINVDFADVKAVMANAGIAHMGIGKASGEQRMVEAAKNAVSSPLVDSKMEGAHGILFSVAGGPDITMQEVHEAAKFVTLQADRDAKIIMGAVIDRAMPKRSVRVTVVATGLGSREAPKDAASAATPAGPRALRTASSTTSGAPPPQSQSDSSLEPEEDPYAIPSFLRRKIQGGAEKEKDKKREK